MERRDRTNNGDEDVARVANEIASRLRARGITVNEVDSPDDIEALAEAVEAFERGVQRHGGDLMVDEPPPDAKPQPDDPRFLLLHRRADESVTSYIERLTAATAALRRRESR
jgi:hypothetical protein